MRVRALVIALLAGAPLPLACSVISGLDDVSIAGGDNNADAGDAKVVVIGDASVPDTVRSPGPGDDAQGPSDDAATDAPPPCSQNVAHTLCADFDDGGTAAWKIETTTRASIQVDGNLLSTVPDVKDTEGWARLTLVVQRSTAEARLDFDVYPCAATGTGVVYFASVGQDGRQNTFTNVSYGLNPAAPTVQIFSVFEDGGRGTRHFNTPVGLRPGVWAHVRMEITWRPGHLRVFVDGTSVFDKDLALTSGTSTYTELNVGPYTYHTAACTARVDNVVFDVTP